MRSTIFSLLALLLLAACAQTTDTVPNVPEPSDGVDANTVRMTDSGYEPRRLTIQTGESVTFQNVGTRESWPASDSHPTHREYPDSGIEKCGTDEAAQVFDACGGVVPGQTYSFIFNEPGTWEYHDHLNPSRSGVIVVEGQAQAQVPGGDEAEQGQEDQGDIVEIEMTGENFKFMVDGQENPTLRVKEGDTVRIHFTSTQGFHDVVIDEFFAASDRVMAPNSTTLEFVADQAGEFAYYCSVGQHRANGMEGLLIVE